MFTDKIWSLRTTLADNLETEFGLTDKLFSRHVLNKHQQENIEQHKMAKKRISELLSSIAWTDDNNYQEFLTALNKTNQQHVAYFIKCNVEEREGLLFF